jgi:hypothetical protein
MEDKSRLATFNRKYHGKDKIWTGPSFYYCLEELRPLLDELPVSPGAHALRTYPRHYTGNLEMVYGELLGMLGDFEGYFKDRAWPIKECSVKRTGAAKNVGLEFDVDYVHEGGNRLTQTFEVVRQGERQFTLFTDNFRLK